MEQPNSPTMPAGFTYVDRVAPQVSADLKYAGNDNFIGRPMAGYRGHRPILRIEAAQALKKASDSLAKQGYGLLIYDAYRPHTAMIDINQWGKDLTDQKMKAKFYPNIDKATIFKDCYIRDCSEHSRGVALDITLVDLKTKKPVDMGGHHDLLDPSSATASTQVTAKQRKNRQILKQAMEAAGFDNYSLEWWHYRLSPEPDETLYFCFPAWDGMQEK
jgi:D-alanyl-D-alanine dipeptidase